MQRSGGCHCGAVRFQTQGDALHVTLCHCRDCQRSSGAPMVAWAGFKEEQFAVTRGEARTVNSSGDAYRSFCAECGTGLYYRNQTVLPGLVDIQVVTYDDPEAFPPTVNIQAAERLSWTNNAPRLHDFDRYPGA